MSVSNVSSATAFVQQLRPVASDGDSAAQEAAESAGTKVAEKANGGFAQANPKGSINRVA